MVHAAAHLIRRCGGDKVPVPEGGTRPAAATSRSLTRAARTHPEPREARRARPRAPVLLHRPGHLRARDQEHLREVLDLRRARVAGEEPGRFLDVPDRAPADGDGARAGRGGEEGVTRRFATGRDPRAVQPLPAPRRAGVRRAPRQCRRRAHLLVPFVALQVRRHDRVAAAAARLRGHDVQGLRLQHEARAARRVVPRLRVREPRRRRPVARRSGSGRPRWRSTTSATGRRWARSRW